MSQYPSPYTPPTGSPVYALPPHTPDVLAASRRAGLLMFVMGGLTMVTGTCFLAVIIAIPAGQLGQQMQQSASATGQSMPLSDEAMKGAMIALMVIMLLLGIGAIVLGTAVRRGNKWSTIASLVISGLVLAFLGLQAVSMLVMATHMPAAIGVVLMLLVPIALLVLLMVWLIGSLKAQSRMGAAQQQYAAQYWQYQQNLQAYAYAQSQQQSGYSPQGYATAPPVLPASPQIQLPVNPDDSEGPPT